jgi:predicted restriction endonuclease
MVADMPSEWKGLLESVQKRRSYDALFYKPLCLLVVLDGIDRQQLDPSRISLQWVIEHFAAVLRGILPDRADYGWEPLWHLTNDGAWKFYRDGSLVGPDAFGKQGRPKTARQLLDQVDYASVPLEALAHWKDPISRSALRQQLIAMLQSDDNQESEIVATSTFSADAKVDAERAHRAALFHQLRAIGQDSVKPALLNDLKIFYGGRGIWVDKARTAGIGGSADGVTVGLLHTGSSYADDLFDEGVLYHYPQTATSGRDVAEVEATKAARKLELPVFVVTYPFPKSSSRRVQLGWIADWDDNERWFLVTFGETAPALDPAPDDDAPFATSAVKSRPIRAVNTRPNQLRFKFQVFQRYGAECAICGLDVREVLEAAHIIPDEYDGPDDPRNGLVLCRNHHRAYDCGLFLIEPETLALRFVRDSVSASSLAITRTSLQHLRRKPHIDALRWRWASARREVQKQTQNQSPLD